MPRLPGFETLGGTQADPTRPTASYDVTPFARGAQAIAQGAENLGRGVSQVGNDLAEVQRKHNEAQYLNATADTATGLANLHTSLQNDKDFGTLEQRYSDGANDIVQKQAQAIPEGPLRTHYLAKSGELVAHGAGAINKQAYNGIVEADNNGLKVGLDNLTDDIAKNPGNPFRAAQVDALGLKIDNAVNQGWKTPEEATLLKRDIAIRVRSAELQVMATTDPEGFISRYGGSTTRPRLASVKGDESKSTMDPVDAAIPPLTMYHLLNNAQTILIRRQNDELKLGTEKAEKAASEAVARSASGAPLQPGALPISGGRFAPEVNDAISKAAATTGVSEGTLRRFAQIESSGRPNAVTGSYKGLYQLSDAEFAKHGAGNVFNPTDNAMAAAQKLRSEGAAFSQRYGRPATDADLYLIHNQGAGGYAAHQANPNGAAWQNMFSTAEGQIKGPKWAQDAIWGNIPDDPRTSPNFNKQMFPGGVATVSSADFMRGWTAKINGGNNASATLADQKAAALRDVLTNTNLNDKERLHAAHQVEQQFTAWEVATNQNTKARKEASDQAADDWMTRLGNRQGMDTIVQDIEKDERMTWEARHTMSAFAAHVSGQPDATEFGPGWLEAKKQVLADPGDPKHIADPVEIVKRGLPGGDLTQAGVKDILQTMQVARKSADEHGVQSSKAALLTYAKSKLSFDQEMLFPGAPPLRDRRGEQIFNAQFVPRFNSAFNEWSKSGKDPMQFLTQENVDKMLAGLRSPAQMKMDRLAATGESVPEQPGAPPPPTPEGVDPAAWVPLVSSPPMTDAGTPFPRRDWAKALQLLAEKPTAETIKLFDESKFGKAGLEGAKILEQLTAKPKTKAEPVAPAIEPRAKFNLSDAMP